MADTDISFASSSGAQKVWQKAQYRNPRQTSVAKATDIGWVRPQDTRVNLMAALDGGDKQNYYSFKALSDGKLVMAAQTDAAVRIQIMDSHQRVVADSAPNMGQASENYLKMAEDDFTLKSGKYYLKVSRGEGVPSDQRVNFALQLLMGDGTFKNDYLTREVSPTKQERVNALIQPESAKDGAAAVTFLGDFASSTNGNLLASGSRTSLVGTQLSVLA